jgi:hypothetical protein
VWRTLIQYGDDYGVKKLAQTTHPDRQPEFLDFLAWDDMNFCDRKQIHIELAIGMMSDENALARQQIIQKCQNDLYASVQGLMQAGTLTPDMYKKIKKPFADTLYILGIKDANTYLPTDQEVLQLIEQGQQAQQGKEPSPDDKVKLAKANLDTVKAQQIAAETEGVDAESQLDYMSMAMGNPKVYS